MIGFPQAEVRDILQGFPVDESGSDVMTVSGFKSNFQVRPITPPTTPFVESLGSELLKTLLERGLLLEAAVSSRVEHLSLLSDSLSKQTNLLMITQVTDILLLL